MRVWTVANQKGGVGKTTTAVAVGGLLAEQGKRVLLFDLDPQGSMSAYFNYNPDEIGLSVYELFINSETIDPASILVDTSHENLYLMPASTALATLERSMVGKQGMGLVVAKALGAIWEQFDYVLVDCAPVVGVLMVNALAACEQIIMPVQTEFLAIKGLERMLRTLEMVMHSQKRPLNYLVVPTMFDRRTQASQKSLRILRNTYEANIWSSMIPIDTRLRDASYKAVTPSSFDELSRGVKAYRRLLKFLLEHQISFVAE